MGKKSKTYLVMPRRADRVGGFQNATSLQNLADVLKKRGIRSIEYIFPHTVVDLAANRGNKYLVIDQITSGPLGVKKILHPIAFTAKERKDGKMRANQVIQLMK